MRLVVFATFLIFFVELLAFAKSTRFASHVFICSGAPVKHWEWKAKLGRVIGEAFCFPAFQQADGICSSGWRLDIGHERFPRLCDWSRVSWFKIGCILPIELFGVKSDEMCKGAAAPTLRISERGEPGHSACLCLHNMGISHRKLSLLGFCLWVGLLSVFAAGKFNSNLSCNNSFTRLLFSEMCSSRKLPLL